MKKKGLFLIFSFLILGSLNFLAVAQIAEPSDSDIKCEEIFSDGIIGDKTNSSNDPALGTEISK